MPDTPEFVWACGLFEGEGSITFVARTGREHGLWQRRLSLGSTDGDVVHRFHTAVGVGKVNGPYERGKGKYKPMWMWTCNKWSDIEVTLTAMLPWFGERRREVALHMLAHPAGVPGRPKNLERIQTEEHRQKISDGIKRSLEIQRAAA